MADSRVPLPGPQPVLGSCLSCLSREERDRAGTREDTPLAASSFGEEALAGPRFGQLLRAVLCSIKASPVPT